MTTINYLKFSLFIIVCLLFCNNIYCAEQTKAITTQTKTTIEKSIPTDEKHSTDKLKNIKYDRHDDDDKKNNSNKEKDDKSRNDDNGNREENNDDFDRNQEKSSHSQTKSTPSSTIVTTIIVITTETPTIYTGNIGPAQQIGTDNTVTTNTATPSQNPIVGKLIKSRQDYRRLVLILSIVGGVIGVIIITASIIFIRMRKRKRNRALDLESAHSNLQTPPSSPKLPSLAHCRTSSIRSEDGEMTIIDFNQDPFQDPLNTLPYYKTNTMSQNGLTMSPTNLAHPGYHQYTHRQNLTLSMLSQTSAAFPSAPTAKELESVKYEEEYHNEHSHSVINILNEPKSLHNSLPQTTEALSQDLPPPPAYTLCATPSAPPLYALPANKTAMESRHDLNSLRRHSISSCSVISSIRPLSLRRGSGSLAHITFPFS